MEMFLFLTKKFIDSLSTREQTNMLIENALLFFFFNYISILVLFLAAKDEYVFLKWGNIHT